MIRGPGSDDEFQNSAGGREDRGRTPVGEFSKAARQRNDWVKTFPHSFSYIANQKKGRMKG